MNEQRDQTLANASMSPLSLTVLFLLPALGILGLLYFFLGTGTEDQPAKDEKVPEPREKVILSSPPFPPLSRTPFLNTSDQVAYVGAQTCAKCHPREYNSYLRTQHSKSLGEVDIAGEPPDGEFFHAASNRAYRVFRKDNQLWHRESLRIRDGKEILLSEFPMRHVFGSGTHTRSYVVESDGFLVESPVTWYPSKKTWGMSPGFDKPHHGAFQRLANYQCFLCHVGRVERKDNTPERVQIHAQAIDCERCHGPGSLHVAHWKERRGEVPVQAITGNDLTIVHPGKLSRQENEAICAQCHVGDVAGVDVRGRDVGDFRPGRPWTDFRIDFDFDVPDDKMPVIGHFRQMQRSRCYQASKTMTCTSCHDPHGKPEESRKVAYYRFRCLSCHGSPEKACGLEEKVRLKRNAQDSCVACHMPSTTTTVPHVAFTHHKIGLHTDGTEEPARPSGPRNLVPVYDLSHLPELERDRALGLAYWQVSGDSKFAGHAEIYGRRAIQLLKSVRARGLRDANVDAALAIFHRSSQPEAAIELATQTLRYDRLSPEARLDALFVLSRSYYDTRQFKQAEAFLAQMVRARRDAEDWGLLCVCRQQAGNLPGALEAARQAVRINPARPDLQRLLAELYQWSGDQDRARHHREQAKQMER